MWNELSTAPGLQKDLSGRKIQAGVVLCLQDGRHSGKEKQKSWLLSFESPGIKGNRSLVCVYDRVGCGPGEDKTQLLGSKASCLLRQKKGSQTRRRKESLEGSQGC